MQKCRFDLQLNNQILKWLYKIDFNSTDVLFCSRIHFYQISISKDHFIFDHEMIMLLRYLV